MYRWIQFLTAVPCLLFVLAINAQADTAIPPSQEEASAPPSQLAPLPSFIDIVLGKEALRHDNLSPLIGQSPIATSSAGFFGSYVGFIGPTCGFYFGVGTAGQILNWCSNGSIGSFMGPSYPLCTTCPNGPGS